MTPDARRLLAINAELERRRAKARRGLDYSPHKPTVRQQAFLALDCLDALYGGAAGGGKSDALLMAALQYVHEPKYAALILRRTYTDLALPGAIMDRAKSWLIPKGIPWNDKEKRFTFPSGATLTFGYIDTDQDRFRYQSAEFQFIAFDELTQFPEQWFAYMFSRLRRPEGSTIPVRMRAASNPGGIGHEWVRRRYIGASKPFVPAKLDDNPHVDAASYRLSLSELDATTRKQLLDGIWVRDGGGLVYPFSDDANVIDVAPRLEHYYLGIDYGVVDATAFTVAGWRKHDPHVYFVESFKERGLAPSDAAERVRSLGDRYSFARIIADVGGLGKGFAQEARTRFLLPIEAAEKTNKRGYQSLFAGDLEKGRIKVVRGACKPLLDEWAELPWAPDRLKECDGFDNHCADSALYVWRDVRSYHETPAVEPAKAGTDAWWLAQEANLERAVDERTERKHGEEWWMA